VNKGTTIRDAVINKRVEIKETEKSKKRNKGEGENQEVKYNKENKART
jgi:hypothetical protein